jgi:DNA-binding response OmpR family regulator
VTDQLSGLRVLVVEDEILVAMLVEDYLTDCGSIVVGPAATVRQALSMVGTEQLDAVVMDVNIAGEKVFPVAEELELRKIPFLIVSGYGQSAVPANRPTWRVCAKPFKGEDMLAMLRTQITESRTRAR